MLLIKLIIHLFSAQYRRLLANYNTTDCTQQLLNAAFKLCGSELSFRFSYTDIKQ